MDDVNNLDNVTTGETGQSTYTCPGELYSIPRSIHLARLASYFTKCRDCAHRFDTGHAFLRAENEQVSAATRPIRASLLTDENVRGVYLNELDRNRARLWGEAFAAVLWEKQPMVACELAPGNSAQIIAQRDANESALRPTGPVVVVGFDERPSSPDIVSGVVSGLRRMGCSVIDLGQTALPVLAFNVSTLNSTAGLFVGGAGCDPSWTGFDFLAHKAEPFPHEELIRVEQFVATGVNRQTRQIGSYQPFRGQSSYEASLESHFHALRPLRIIIGSSTRGLPRSVDRLFAKLPCEWNHVALPMRRRNLFDVRDVDLVRVASAVVDRGFHLGLLIDENGQHVAFVTDRGRLVTPREVSRLLIEIALRENHAAQFVVANSWRNDVQQWLSGRDATAIDGGESTFDLVRTLVEHQATLALSGDGRVWFRHTHPTCDALLILANTLQALSLSDAPFSEVISRINP